jgi:hypothetical protein
MIDNYALDRIIELTSPHNITNASTAHDAIDRIAAWAKAIKRSQPKETSLIPRLWYPISTLPCPRELVLIRGKSFQTPYPVFLSTGFHDPEWRPLDPWRDINGDSFSYCGHEPREWSPITTDLIQPQAQFAVPHD